MYSPDAIQYILLTSLRHPGPARLVLRPLLGRFSRKGQGELNGCLLSHFVVTSRPLQGGEQGRQVDGDVH